MPTRNVVLTEQQAALIASLVESGRYQNASEVVRDGIRMIERREVEDRAKLDALRAAIAVGDRDIQRGAAQSFATADDLAAYLATVGTRTISDCIKN